MAVGANRAARRPRVRRKRSYHHGDLRRALIEAALQLVEDQGVKALTLREVSARTGVTQGAPYHHFADKMELLAALAEEGYRAMYAEMIRGSSEAGSEALDRLHAIGLAYVRFAAAHPAYFQVMFRSDLVEFQRFPSLLEVADRTFMLLATTVHEAYVGGNLAGDEMSYILVSWGLVHGLSTLWVDGPLRRMPRVRGEIAAIAESATTLLTHSFAAMRKR